ncbi:MAG: hypothetical protein NTY59_00535 [Alphaproteobacteria bacterium]|nr:hypothetical protein [Alphaproteobacteria bacterium]
MPNKRVSFDERSWQALKGLGRDAMKDFQELADEAFRDFLRKHNQPMALKAQLRESLKPVRAAAASEAAER